MQASTVKKINHVPMLFVFTAVILLGALFLYLYFAFPSEPIDPEIYEETQATISDIQEFQVGDGETEYFVFIDYEFGGQTFTDKPYGKYDSSMKKGDTVTVFVNRTEPDDFTWEDDSSFIFPLLSAIFVVVGIGGLIYNVKKLKELKRREE